MRKNLLSITQFCSDNYVLCALDAHHFYSFDLFTSSLLCQGLCKGGLYKLLVIPPCLYALSATLNSSSLWHHRLDHPSTKIMSCLGSDKLPSPTFHSKSLFCAGCALEKSTRISFPNSHDIKTSFPFALAQFDV